MGPRQGSVLSDNSSRHSHPVQPFITHDGSNTSFKWKSGRGSDASAIVRFSNKIQKVGEDDNLRLDQIIARMERRLEKQLLEISSLLRNADTPRTPAFVSQGGSFLPPLPNLFPPGASAFSSRAQSRSASRRASAQTNGGASARGSTRASALHLPSSKAGSRRQSGAETSKPFSPVVAKFD